MEKEKNIQHLTKTFYPSYSKNSYGTSTRSNFDKNITITSIKQTLQIINHRISNFLSSHHSVFASNNPDAFLGTIDDLIATINSLETLDNNQTLLNQSENLLQRCMHQLEHEFLNLTKEHGANPNRDLNEAYHDDASDSITEILIAVPVKDYDIIVDLLPPGRISDLNKIAQRMVSAGFGHDYVELYVHSRQNFLDESLERLGFSSLVSEEIKSIPWTQLELKIARWVLIFNTVFRILIPSERLLCDRLFEGLDPFDNIAFASVSRKMGSELISFAYSIASASRAPQCLFRILDMYESARDLLPDIDTVFFDEYSAPIYAEVEKLCGTICSSIKGILMEFENLIRNDPLGIPVLGGRVHPITRYVMNYLKTACGWRETLEEVISTGSGTECASSVDLDRSSFPLAVNFTWIMDNLQKNLEAKSKAYGESYPTLIFLMNNGKYIVTKAKDCELHVILGEDWMNQMDGKISRWVKSYLNSWTKIASLLELNDEAMMLDSLRYFNKHVEKTFRVQSEWIIVDYQTMSELRAFITAILLPVYREFLSRVSGITGRGELDIYVRFSPEELEARINGLFQVKKKRS